MAIHRLVPKPRYIGLSALTDWVTSMLDLSLGSVAIIGGLVANFSALVTLAYNLVKERNTRILGFLKDTDEEISRQIEKEEKVNDFNGCLIYAYNYLDIMERISYLQDARKIPKYLGEYYHTFFDYAVTIMFWYTTAYNDKHSPGDSWPSLIGWFKEHDMHPYEIRHLPDFMQQTLKRDKASPTEMLQEISTIIARQTRAGRRRRKLRLVIPNQ